MTGDSVRESIVKNLADHCLSIERRGSKAIIAVVKQESSRAYTSQSRPQHCQFFFLDNVMLNTLRLQHISM
jgi:hypothetical protein